jgi:regulatory protein
MIEWNVPENFHEPILDQLRVENFINDERFATAFTNDKLKLSKWGKTKIRYALQSKLIENHAIEKALGQIDSVVYEKIALSLINSKIRQAREPDENKLKQKVLRFLASRGFEYGMVFDLWDKKE